MNSKQQIALIIGLVSLVMLWLIPPWMHTDSQGVGQSMGYAPIWKPPVQTKSKSADILGFRFDFDESIYANTIDWSTLMAEAAVVALLTGASIAVLGLNLQDRSQKKVQPGSATEKDRTKISSTA